MWKVCHEHLHVPSSTSGLQDGGRSLISQRPYSNDVPPLCPWDLGIEPHICIGGLPGGAGRGLEGCGGSGADPRARNLSTNQKLPYHVALFSTPPSSANERHGAANPSAGNRLRQSRTDSPARKYLLSRIGAANLSSSSDDSKACSGVARKINMQ
jgi:hypothetical protein